MDNKAQKRHRPRGASFEARRPQGGASQQCIIIPIVPLGPAYKTGLAGHFPAEPLECDDHWILRESVVGLNNEGLVRGPGPMPRSFKGGRPAFAEAASRRQV